MRMPRLVRMARPADSFPRLSDRRKRSPTTARNSPAVKISGGAVRPKIPHIRPSPKILVHSHIEPHGEHHGIPAHDHKERGKQRRIVADRSYEQPVADDVKAENQSHEEPYDSRCVENDQRM